DLFARGGDLAMWHRWNVDAQPWGDWESLGGVLSTAFAPVAWSENRLQVCALGTDSKLYTKWWSGAVWGGWTPQEGVTFSQVRPTAAARAPDRLDVFGVASDSSVRTRAWNGSAWGDWISLGGVVTSEVCVIPTSPGTLHIFVRGTDSGLHHRWWTESAGWEP
ncbi:MAG TPA: hypothetical protein VFH27_08720, partial [Longimicrobiaceae bacterium]|nr:hypothetical protein [Longimicrobiaceae bacterium]